MIRVLLIDAQWERIAPLLPGKEGDPGRSGEDNRRFVEAVLWIICAGAPWRDLPEAFGKWSSVWKRFRRWVLKGVFERIFAALSDDPDFEYALIDGTIVRFTGTVPAQKGDSKSGDRQVTRRADHLLDDCRHSPRLEQPQPTLGVAGHHLERGAEEGGEVDLVDDEEIGSSDAGAALARDFFAARDVDDIDSEVGELRGKGGGEIVAARFSSPFPLVISSAAGA